MIRLNSTSRKVQNALALNPRLPATPPKVIVRAEVSLAIIRYAYYGIHILDSIRINRSRG